jgi:hypothetical protein
MTMLTESDIATEYARRLVGTRQPDWGWSFMYTPESTLERARVILVGLNPGGDQVGRPSKWDYRSGVNAYLDESWRGLSPGKHHLQVQVAALFLALGVAGSMYSQPISFRFGARVGRHSQTAPGR